MTDFEVYTDGSCGPTNPGPGGWAAVIVKPGASGVPWLTVTGRERLTTNNRMEMLAVIEGLRGVTNGSRVRVTTDSKYVMRGFTEWLPGWRRRAFRTAAGHPVKNLDLWTALTEAVDSHVRVEWEWTRGHDGHRWNETAHMNAEAARLGKELVVLL